MKRMETFLTPNEPNNLKLYGSTKTNRPKWDSHILQNCQMSEGVEL